MSENTQSRRVTLRTAVYRNLVEALRRHECFAVRRDGLTWSVEDLQKSWCGLGFPTEYRSASESGYMRPVPHETRPRIMGWWSLTHKGAMIVKAWHDAGYACGDDYVLVHLPPSDVMIDG